MGQKKNNTSLFVYTGLIFFVAIVLILIAFFGQSNLERKQPVPLDSQNENSITQRTALLSEENKSLLEKNKELQNKINEQGQEITDLATQLETYKQGQEITAQLFSAGGYVTKKMYTEAEQILTAIDPSSLTEDQSLYYDSLMKKIRKD